jgi:DNA-directed RNA polymerase subunit H (RpoH/RPB5)
MRRALNIISIVGLIFLFATQGMSFGLHTNLYIEKAKDFERNYKYGKVKVSCERVKKSLTKLAEIKISLPRIEATHPLTKKSERDVGNSLVVQVCTRNKFNNLSKRMNRFLKNFAKYTPIKCKYEKRQVNHSERIAISSGGLWYFYRNDINEVIRLFCPDLKEHIKERKSINEEQGDLESVDP